MLSSPSRGWRRDRWAKCWCAWRISFVHASAPAPVIRFKRRPVMLRTVTLLALLSLPAWPANGPLQEATASAFISSKMPGFYNGYLFSAEPKHVLTLFAPDGHELFSLPFQGRGNGKVGIESVAIDSDGTLA